MAEFKLGRIKFVWKGAWNTGTTYYIDDVVRYGGKTFICTEGHVGSASFYTDLNNIPTKWNQFTDGQDWKGDWTGPGTLYKVNDIVKYGGLTYICTLSHTSQNRLEDDISSWDLISSGISWIGDWTVGTTYKVNDIVKYGGLVYLCNSDHTSASTVSQGLEFNQSDWDLFNEGFDWKGDWSISTRYKKNDVVKYGGQIYVCNTHHNSADNVTAGLENDQAKWDYFQRGIEFKGDWSNSSVRYKVNDLVRYGGSIWRCNTPHTSTASFDTVKFELFVKGLEFENGWNNSTIYQVGDIVKYGGHNYVAKAVNNNQTPTAAGSLYWDLFTTGLKFEGDYNPSTSYRVGEVVRNGGYTYVAIQDTVGNNPPSFDGGSSAYWSKLNSGLRWRTRWENSTSYVVGDVVSYNQFSYVCIQSHVSDDDDSTITPTVNSPEKDTAGVYWNLLTSGLEESVLTTPGDLVYFGPSGVSRLPVGEEGQVLTVVNGLPAWTIWGKSDYVFYVAAHGVDEQYPVQGATLDKPWKTIRYATEQIENGFQNLNAAYLLKQNRTFIQKEIVEWTDYQIANNIAPFTSLFTYNKALCQRDMGLLLDAIINDLTKGGNTKSLEVARSYFTPLGASYILGQEEETVSSINYGLQLVERVLANLAPDANYQELNGIAAGDRIKHVFNFNYQSEAGTLDVCQRLVKIVTDAITAGNLNSLAKEVIPGYTINVKTGLFEEVLPIIVPANTAIVGDELRSTRVSPSGKLIATNDKAKSLATISRLKTITGNIIQNIAVTPTTGNTVAQDRTSQKAGDVGSTVALNSVIANAAEIKDVVTNNTPNAYVYPNPTGYDAGYSDARRLILANKAFLKDEVSTWILAQIAGNVAPFVGFVYAGTGRAKCERDVGYIVDALVYDLTYGGNLATQIAARSYYSKGVFVETGEKAQALAVQLRIKDIIDNIATGNTAGWTKTTALAQDVSGTPGSAPAAAFAQARIQEIYDTINTGAEPATIAPTIAWVSAPLVSARNAILAAKAEIQDDAVAFVRRQFPTLVFDETLCSRDVGYMVDALSYDLMFGSNFLSIQNGLAYRRGLASTNLVITEQLSAQQAIIDFVGLKASEIASGGAVVFADLLWSYIGGIVNTGAIPVNTGTNRPTTNLDMINGANILRLNSNFLAAEATAYIDNTYKATVTASTGSTTDTFTCSDTSWMVAGDTIRFTGTTFGGVTTGVTYYVQSIPAPGTFKVSSTLGGAALDLSTDTGSMTVNWYYNKSRCQNDVRRYIEAIADDMVYTGNYHVVLAARYYRNALTGSKLEDMYYVRNGCGIRNQSLIGLDGTSDGDTTGVQSALLPANAYGTSRPRAGSYVSLDPGWGPNDTRVWVTNKSTYVQNVTTFGTGCVGQKIDGALHAGGNDSIVSNDFTQVLSDGIGAWVTNLGRAELVSVFTYYNHIGYLAENGGKIRATNGNNSYGDFGSVAEGIDPTETPIIGTVNNRGNEANVANALVNNEVQLLEYANAGINYSSASYTISGSGTNAAAVGNEFRDGGVYQVRLTDPGDPTLVGGAGYVSASNVAQTGTTTSITLAATDTALSTAYVGMGIWLVSGTGAGQYGYINSFNAGSKIAQIYKSSTGTPGWDHVIPGTTIAPTLDLTTTYEIVPRLTFAAPPYSKALRSGLGSIDYKDIVYGDSYGSYTGVTATGGTGSSAQFSVIRRDGIYTVTLTAGGFGYTAGNELTVSGTAIGGTSPANDLTIIVETVGEGTDDITSISYSGTAIKGQWIALASGTNRVYTSPDGQTWTERTLPATAKWQSIAYGIVGNFGTWVACARESNQTVYSTDGISWTASSLGAGEEWDWNSIAYGNGRFVMVSESDSSTTRRAVSIDGGQSWTLGNVNTGATAITYGSGRFVIVEGNFSNSAAYSADGVTWTNRTLPSNADSTESNWKDVAYGNGRFVAIADNDAQVAISIDRGVTWFAAKLPQSAPWKRVSYGNGVFLAFAEGNIAASSQDGINWISRDFQATDLDILSTNKDRIVNWASSSSIGTSTWGVIGFGGGKFVAVNSDGVSVGSSYSTDGKTWTAGTFDDGSGTVTGIAYGDGFWVAPYAGSNDVATSTDGITFTFRTNVLTATLDWGPIAYGGGRFITISPNATGTRYVTSASLTSNISTIWTAGGALTTSAEWTDIIYGGTRFVAISGSTADSDIVNWSTDGTSWTAATMPSASRWSSITYGNGKFVAVAGNSGTTTTKAAYSTNGATWIAATLPGAAANWNNISFNGSVFVATAYGSNRCAVSEDGITWSSLTMADTANWTASASNSAYITVTVATGSNKTNLLEYEANTNLITIFSTSNLAIGDYIVIPNDSAGIEKFGGLATDTRYYVRSIYDSTRFTISTTSGGIPVVLTTGSGSMYATVNKIWSAIAYGNGSSNNGFMVLATNNPTALNVYVGGTARGRPFLIDDKISAIWIHEPGSNYSSATPPTMTITDPNNTGADASHQVRVGNGVLGQPSWTNRGTGYVAADATITGNGVADNYQVGAFVNFENLTDRPTAGSNLQIAGINNIYFKIVTVRNLVGVGKLSAQLQLSPSLEAANAPDHGTATTIRSRFSQVRLTGHDFLEIGTGNKVETNYPGLPLNGTNPANETVLSGGGRVFWTSTDQDGNFRVGGLFNVEQATGTATLNAEAFNLAGLNELSLGSVALGGGGAAITEFSTDPFFTADSDAIVPTQRAIKAYISGQIGGGSGSLNVNTITAGSIYIAGNTITTTTLGQININTTVNFTGGVDGYPVALNLFLQA